MNNLEPVIEFSYDQEKLTPYSYSVYLDEQQIQVDYGLSHQSAAYDMEFETDAPVHLVLNSRSGAMSWDGKAVSGFQIIQDNTGFIFTCSRKSYRGGWCFRRWDIQRRP